MEGITEASHKQENVTQVKSETTDTQIEPPDEGENFAVVKPMPASNGSVTISSPSSRPPVPSARKTDPQSSVFYCPLCSFFTYSKQGFSLHLKRHSKASEIEIVQSAMMAASGHTDLSYRKNYVCNICGKQLSSKCSLARHGLVHSGLKPYRCSVCSAAFTTSGNLSRHMKIHSTAFQAAGIAMSSATSTEPDESDHTCSLCGMMFKNSKGLRMHNFMIHRTRKPDDANPETYTDSPMDVKNENDDSENEISRLISDATSEVINNTITETKRKSPSPKPENWPLTTNEHIIKHEVEQTVKSLSTSNVTVKKVRQKKISMPVNEAPTPKILTPQGYEELTTENIVRQTVEQYAPTQPQQVKQEPQSLVRPQMAHTGLLAVRHQQPRNVNFAHLHGPPRVLASATPSGTIWHPYMPVFQPQPTWNNYLIALQNVPRTTTPTQYHIMAHSHRIKQEQKETPQEPLDLSITSQTVIQNQQTRGNDEHQFSKDEPLDLSMKTQPEKEPASPSPSIDRSQAQSNNTWVSGFQWLKSIAEMSKQKDMGKKFQCSECQLQFDNMDSLNIHLTSHRMKRPKHSPTIAEERKMYESPINVHQAHRRQVDGHQFPFVPAVPNVNLFATQTNCGIIAPGSHPTTIGINLPSTINPATYKDGDGKFQCNMCPKRFTVASSLSRHIKYHNLHRPYVCKYCDASFTYRYNCSRHMIKFHSCEKHFPCLFCTFQATNAYQLDEHVQLMHPNVKQIDEPQDVPMD